MADRIADKLEIQENVNKFCYGIDTKVPLADFPGYMEQIFTEDLQLGLSRQPCKNGDKIELQPMGVKQFSAFVGSVQKKYVATNHHCTNFVIEFTGEKTAFSKSYATNYHWKQEKHGGGKFDFYGIYEDELVKIDGLGWRIKARKQYPLMVEGTVSPSE